METEVLDVNLIGRMLQRAKEAACADVPPPANVVEGRFARSPAEFETKATKR